MMLSNILKRGLLSTNPWTSVLRYASTSGQHTVLVVLYEGGEAGKKNKNILGCVENALGLPEWIKENKLEDRLKLIVTSDKDSENSLAEKVLHKITIYRKNR
ncbi:unnamed protein product [Rotaria sp. Silwood1]|nr:unnamed protein product [Rotaria sp. Silwood1]